jgi:osmotically-inducible protein OsmY
MPSQDQQEDAMSRARYISDVEDGYVTLRGTVQSASERRHADILARAVGARGVDNRLQLERDADARAS